MKELDVREIITAKAPNYFSRYPRFVEPLLVHCLSRLLRVEEINRQIRKNAGVKGVAFIDEVFEDLDFSYYLSSIDRNKIPSEGKLVVVANHPLGALDGLALLRAISEVRPDVRIIANDVLMNFENLEELFLPYDVFSRHMQKEHIARIGAELLAEKAILFFPAAEVSRLTWKGIRDPQWLNGPVFFAKKYDAPVLPVFIKGRNSILFYAVSLLYKRFSTLLLPREIFNKRGKSLRFVIGDPIPGAVFTASYIKTRVMSRLLRKQTYLLARKKKTTLFRTEKTIIHPVDRRQLKEELAASTLLGQTSDGKKIYLVEFERAHRVLREIARLREQTFRKVGEGTGLKLDLDRFDRYYQHIVLWDDAPLEIIGSYRVGSCQRILAGHGVEGLYTHTLFKYSPAALPILNEALELGRSFVQVKYWKSNALDYLWQGIGAYLAHHPEIRYLIGPVSISNTYTERAKELLVYFYQTWFPGDPALAPHVSPFRISLHNQAELALLFPHIEYREELRKLKEALKMLGFSIPVLYKQYSELCEEGGVAFIDFGVDKDFADCIDGLILVRIDLLRPNKRERYITINQVLTT
ncbi:MAG TPA: GNAT family N-acyltransferase [bacterium]|nr:GNAT family N-acyltransferase [bacterium]HQI49785.1 GNAT family N-acyltransferase [bacterium]HQJ63182.1 GNAT family N-acyltransferase [bacterium]